MFQIMSILLHLEIMSNFGNLFEPPLSCANNFFL